MSQRIRSRTSSPGSPLRSSPTTRGGTCAAATSPSTSKGDSERIRFDTAAQVVEALTDRFGIDLTGLGDVEARVNEVLDS